MTQNEALTILKTGANVFLTGEPGAGKTHTINSYIQYLREHGIELAVTASTGIAATHIGGLTIHSWSGIGIKKTLTKYDLDKIASNEYVGKRIRKAKVLIIDEVSMLQAETLSMIDAVCREVKQSDDAFGGMQIILVGDFFQLPPVEKRFSEEQAKLYEEKKLQFAYEANIWGRAQFVVCYITEQFRQDDKEFLDILCAIRKNKVEEKHRRSLGERRLGEKVPENITKLFSHNLDVDNLNTEILNKIKDEQKKFRMETAGKESLVAILKKGCLSPEILELKKGAVVMCTKNNQKERFVNGTLGTVVDFDENSGFPVIKTIGGRNIKIEPMEWVIEDNGKIKAKITQIPLRLAWAITIHKSQGMSMDAALVDLSAVFEYGQGYVALSRVRRLSGLYLLGINEKALEINPKILKQDGIFLADSKKAQEFFDKLPGEEIKTLHKNFILALGGKWKDKNLKIENKKERAGPDSGNFLERIRAKHPKAYKPWLPNEEGKLIMNFKGGMKVKELSKILERQPGGIRARLEKLGLINK